MMEKSIAEHKQKINEAFIAYEKAQGHKKEDLRKYIRRLRDELHECEAFLRRG